MTTSITKSRRMRSASVAILCVAMSGAAATQQPEVATSVAFTEGPAVDRDGNVYSEMVSLRIMKLSANGQLSTFREQSNNANGLLIDPQGRVTAGQFAAAEQRVVKP